MLHSPPTAAPSSSPASALAITPLWATLVFTFANSIGTGLVNNGVFFLTKAENGYAFSAVENLWLAVAIGVMYIVGAKGAGPTLRLLRRRFPGMTSRAFLGLIMLLMATLCAVPPVLGLMGVEYRSTLGLIGLGVLTLGYSPLSGALWPMVESYVSGGRRGAELRSAIGIWNVVWSSAIPVAYWGMGGFIASSTLLAFAVLVGVHIASAMLTRWFRSEPAPHAVEGHEPAPAIYARLLNVLRLLLPLAYVLTSALGPILPELLGKLNVRAEWRPVIGSAWLVPRAISFYVLQRWHGWHGTWATPIVGTLLIFLGFAGAVLCPSLGDSTLTMTLIIASLMCFGIGMATLYSAAIYYAMEVGQSEVDAGGTHEALIGIGYTVGPLCGLAGVGAVSAGMAGTYQHVVVVAVAGVLGLATAAMAVRVARRGTGSGNRH